MKFSEALDRLNQKLKDAGIRIEIVVCGAVAIELLGYSLERPTDDMDSMIEISRADVLELIAEVGLEYGLGERWLNDQASTVSFPRGTLERAKPTGNWSHIDARVVDRIDLIATKASAFATRRDFTPKDFDDLVLLKPTVDEMEHAIQFLQSTQPPPQGAPKRVIEEFQETIDDLRKIARHTK